jgi:hypothetical protein
LPTGRGAEEIDYDASINVFTYYTESKG